MMLSVSLHNGAVTNCWNLILVLIPALANPHELLPIDFVYAYYSTSIFLKLEFVCISACIQVVIHLHTCMCCLPPCTNIRRQIGWGRTELAARLCVLVKGQCVHNVGAVEYQGL